MKGTSIKRRSLLVTLILTIIPTITLLIVGMNVALFKVIQRINYNSTLQTCEKLVESSSENISARLKSIEDQTMMLSRYCSAMSLSEEQSLELLKLMVGSSDGLFLYGGYINSSGTVYSTISGGAGSMKEELGSQNAQSSEGKIMVTDRKPSVLDPTQDVIYVLAPAAGKSGGNFALAIDANKISEIISKININGSGSASIVNQEETRLQFNIHQKDKIGKMCFTDSSHMRGLDLLARKMMSGVESGHASIFDTRSNSDEYLMVWRKIPNSRWFLTLNISCRDLDRDRLKIRDAYLLAGFTVFILSFLSILLSVKHWVVKPLDKLKKVVEEFTDGKMYNAAKLSYGKRDEIGDLYDNVSKMANKLIDTTSAIRNQSELIVTNSHELNTSAEHILESMSDQASAVEEISTTIEQMSSSIAQTASNAENTRSNSESIANDISKVAAASDNTLESTRMIIEKIKIINEIAKKTDLLSINAAVEAARAGDNGRGFSTVAAEIKKLAERSREAAIQIDEASNKTLAITEESTRMIEQITPRITDNAEKVSEIAIACTEQKNGAEQINNAIQQLASISVENSTEAEMLVAKAENFVKYADTLTSNMKFFKTSDSKGEMIKEITEKLKSHSEQIESLRKELVCRDAHEAEMAAAIEREKALPAGQGSNTNHQL